jgi:hypothetical protein
MSRPFDDMFQCDLCYAHLDNEFYGMQAEVEGELVDVCKGCVEDNEVNVA